MQAQKTLTSVKKGRKVKNDSRERPGTTPNEVSLVGGGKKKRKKRGGEKEGKGSRERKLAAREDGASFHYQPCRAKRETPPRGVKRKVDTARNSWPGLTLGVAGGLGTKGLTHTRLIRRGRCSGKSARQKTSLGNNKEGTESEKKTIYERHREGRPCRSCNRPYEQVLGHWDSMQNVRRRRKKQVRPRHGAK